MEIYVQVEVGVDINIDDEGDIETEITVVFLVRRFPVVFVVSAVLCFVSGCQP